MIRGALDLVSNRPVADCIKCALKCARRFRVPQVPNGDGLNCCVCRVLPRREGTTDWNANEGPCGDLGEDMSVSGEIRGLALLIRRVNQTNAHRWK